MPVTKMPVTKIINGTNQNIRYSSIRNIVDIPAGGSYDFKIDPNATYREDVFEVGNIGSVRISCDDVIDSCEITIFEELYPQKQLKWRITRARGIETTTFTPSPYSRLLAKFRARKNDTQRPSSTVSPNAQDKANFDDLRRDASSMIEAIEALCTSLGKLLNQVKICLAQCTYLVKACLNGMQHVKTTYRAVSENDMWQLFCTKKLKQLVNSLYRLLSTLDSTRNLLQACGTHCFRMGLVLCIPSSAPVKNPFPSIEEDPSPSAEETASSKFDLILKELSWNLETIHYALHLTTNMKLKWNENRCRYVLEIEGSVPKSAELGLVDSDRLLGEDRDHLLSKLQDRSLSAPNSSISQCINEILVFISTSNWSNGPFAPVFKQRLQPDTSNQSTGISAGKRSSVPQNYWIDHKDLQFRKCLSGGNQLVYAGKWCGQTIAMRILKDTTKAAVEREAAVMLKVQHPNVVDFYGCAFTDNGPPPVSGGSAGYIVMELLQEDLRKLIDRLIRLPNQGGGPFHIAVAIDILLQIVGAMIHMHNRDVTHRDLKAANCLVSPRSSTSFSKSPLPTLWTVKLIDFETSKELNRPATADCLVDTGTSHRIVPEVHTSNTGTRRWTAPEVFAPKGVALAPYNPKSADVYSFGMVCYEVVTGLLPFHDECVGNSDIYEALCKGKRPVIPPSTSCPEGLKDIMKKCWLKEDERPDFKAIQMALWEIKYELEKQ